MQQGVTTYQQYANRQQCDSLVLEHLEFVRHVMGRIALNLPDGVDLENLEAAGVLGLVEAAQQFDPQRGVQFRTYAFPRIHGAIIDELRRNCPLPQRVLIQIGKVRRATEQLQPPVTVEQIAQHTELSPVDVENCLVAMRLLRPGTWDDTRIAIHPAHHTSASEPDERLQRNESTRILAAAIEDLPEQDRLVITLYHLENLRLKEIGNILNLSESRVSRLLARAEEQLRGIVTARGG